MVAGVPINLTIPPIDVIFDKISEGDDSPSSFTAAAAAAR